MSKAENDNRFISSQDNQEQPALEGSSSEDLFSAFSRLTQRVDSYFVKASSVLEEQENKVRQSQNLVYLGFVVLIIMVAGMLIDTWFNIYNLHTQNAENVKEIIYIERINK